MKRVFRTVQSRLLTACALLSFIFLIQLSCTKIDTRAGEGTAADATERFFQIPAGTIPEVVRVIGYLKAQNSQHNFVDAFVSQQGMPVWNKAILKPAVPTASIGGSGADTVIVIPFVLNNENLVNGCIKATLNGNITTIAYRRDQYAQLPFAATTTTAPLTAEQYAMQMMYMDKYVFGHSSFKVTDSRLFYFHGSSAGDTAATTKIVLKDSSTTGNYNTIENCQTIISFHCVGGGQCDKYTGACDLCWRCLSWNTFCSLDIGGEPPLGIPLPSGPGGTGGNGGGTPPGNGGGNPPPAPGSGTGNHGTEPLIDWDSPNQSIIDSLQGYPCAQNILAQLPSVNTNTENVLRNIFSINDLVNITFIADSMLPPDVNGYTQGSSMVYNPNTGAFSIKIRLNTWVLRNSSKEFIAKTMYHESIHAFIDYYWKQYKNGQMDSTTFKNQFPLIWIYKTAPYSNLAQHTQIANSYIGNIKSIVQALSPTVPDSVNTAIAWSGLDETQAWKNLGNDTLRLINLRLIARGNYTVANMLALGLTKCP